MKQQSLFQYLAANYFQLIGGMFIGFSIPIGEFVFSPLKDLIIFSPLGILLMATSYYYKFVRKC